MVLLAILAAAAALRVVDLGRTSLWLDEYFSLECSSGWGRSDARAAGSSVPTPDMTAIASARPWTTVWSAVEADENHPPLYFIVLRGWRELFGDSAVAVRSLSVLAGVAAVGLIFAVGRESFGFSAGLWSAAVMAFAAPEIQKSREARSYMLLTAVALLAWLMVVRIERRGPATRRFLTLAAAAAAMPLLHYLALPTLLAMVVYVLARVRDDRRREALGALVCGLTCFAAVWLPAAMKQHAAMLNDTLWLSDPAASHALATLGRLMTWPVRMLFIPAEADLGIAALGSVAIFLPALAFFGSRFKATGRRAAGREPLLLAWLWLVCPLLVLLLIDAFTGRRTLNYPRYAVISAPGLYVLLGAMASRIRRVGWVIPASAALAGLLSLQSTFAPSLPDWRPLARFVHSGSAITGRGIRDQAIVFVGSRSQTSGGELLLGTTYNLDCLGTDTRREAMMVVNAAQPLSPAARLRLDRFDQFCVVGDEGAGTWAWIRREFPGDAVLDASRIAGLGTAIRVGRNAAYADLNAGPNNVFAIGPSQ